MSEPLRVIFAGTPDFAAIHLDALVSSQHEVVGVYTQPDRPKGRGKQLQASPVKQVAENANLPVFQPKSLKEADAQEALQALGADIMVVVAYGLLLPQAVLDIPRLGCINVHGSILPRWRGAAPIQRAIEAGDTESGVTIMQMEAGLDTGPMLLKAFCPIHNDDTASTLHDRLADIGPPALLDALEKLANAELTGEVQDDELANYAKKLSKEEGLINWQLPANELALKIRAFNPFPMTYTLINSERLRILEAQTIDTLKTQKTPGTILEANAQGITVACASGALKLTRLQLPGKKPMAVADIMNGFADKFQTDSLLGETPSTP